MRWIDFLFLANNLLFKSVIYSFKPIRAVYRLTKEAIAIFFFLGEGICIFRWYFSVTFLGEFSVLGVG